MHEISYIYIYIYIYIGSICDTLSKCMSNFRVKSKSRVNWAYGKFYMMIRQSYWKIELIENFPCNDQEELNNREKEIYDKLTIYIYVYI